MMQIQKNIVAALQSLRPNSEWIVDGDKITWLDKVQTEPTAEELQVEIDRQKQQAPLDACKAEAKQRLADTDWSVLPDVGVKNKLEFETYRSAIRALVLNPVADPVWPTEPQPVWN